MHGRPSTAPSDLSTQVQSISLANNGLSSANALQTLDHYLPGLRNLSLANNKLRVFKDLDCLSSRKGRLLKLKELVMNGNPIREVAIANGHAEQYRS